MDVIAFMCACMGVHTNPSWVLGNLGWLCVHTYEIYIYQQSLFLLEIQWISIDFIGFQWFSMDFIQFMCACMGVHTNPSWLLGNPGWLCVPTYEIYIYQQAWFL